MTIIFLFSSIILFTSEKRTDCTSGVFGTLSGARGAATGDVTVLEIKIHRRKCSNI